MQNIIPYDYWINSQLSVARHYGSISIDWKTYVVDYIFSKENEKGLVKPDLIEQSLYEKMQQERPEEVKAYYEEGMRREKEKFSNLPF